MSKSSYTTKQDGPFVFITDHNKGTSVTNNIEKVLVEVQEDLGHPIGEFYIVYQDTMGRIDGVQTKDNKFHDFYAIGAKTFDEAKSKVKENLQDV
jgi:hypothetical protein